jgi:hypothetical protein
VTSPFSQFANSEITFQVADSSSYSINAVGNAIASTRELTITALLKESQNFGTLNQYASEIQKLGGVEGRVSLLKGYLVEPTTYPVQLQFMMEGLAKIKGILRQAGSDEVIGKFKLLPIIQSPYLVATTIDIVTPIQGIFRVN